jgi:hypothetical protein
MSIQVGTTNLTNYRTFKDQLYLTTSTSNQPLLDLDSTHASCNIQTRAGIYYYGQSNTNFLLGFSNHPIFSIQSPSYAPAQGAAYIKFHSNVYAPDADARFERVFADTLVSAPSIVGSNLTIATSATGYTDPFLVVQNANSNLFVVNGYNDMAYFTGKLGIGTTLPRSALDAPSARLGTTNINTLGFNGSTAIYLSNVLGSAHFTQPTIFESTVDIAGRLTAGAFDITDLTTNQGTFRSNVVINDALAIRHSSNQVPSFYLQRNFPSSNANMFSNVAELQPIGVIEYITRSNINDIQTPVSHRVLTIDPTGKIGIGTTSPQNLFEVRSYDYAISVSNENAGLVGIYGDGEEDFIVINSNAFVGIGTAFPKSYIDFKIPSCNAFLSNSADYYINIHSNSETYLVMDYQGRIGIGTNTSRTGADLFIHGVMETTDLKPYRITMPADAPENYVNFSGCNVGGIDTVYASNIDIQIITGSNIYCDLIVASNYDLLAFNSYRATKELELELDDMIFTGCNSFIVAKHYPLYFDVIGASNPNGNLDGTTDPTLANKPTDHVIHPLFGKIHIVADDTSNIPRTTLADGRLYNNAVVGTSSNMFYGYNCNVATFMHTQGKVGSGFSFGLTEPRTNLSDALCRFSLDPYPYNIPTPIDTYGYDTATLALEPYGPASRRIAFRYNYTENILQTPKIYVAGSTISSTIPLTDLNNMSGFTLYAKGNQRIDATDGTTTLYTVRRDNIIATRMTFSIGQHIEAPTDNHLEVNGKSLFKDNMRVEGKIYANSVISQTSDRRLKDNFRVIEDPLKKIKQLTGYVFDRTDIHTTESGLIAQDVQAILPEVVHENSDGFLSISYGNMAGLFVESMKVMMARVESLEAQLAALRRT